MVADRCVNGSTVFNPPYKSILDNRNGRKRVKKSCACRNVKKVENSTTV
jgi:hypothetical protein